jgi:hypothetical protein
MSATLASIVTLVANGEVLISQHGYDRAAAAGISTDEIIAGVAVALLVEDYPTYHKGPSVLVLQRDRNGGIVHCVWGIPAGQTTPASLVTVYRPDPAQWSLDFMRRVP